MKNRFLLLVLLGTALAVAPLSAQPAKIRVACIGNSITFGYSLPNPATQSYPALLQAKMGADDEVRNFGHSGATLMRKGYNPYDKTKEFAEALAFRPDIAVICLGVNDTDPRTWSNYRDDFVADYTWLIDTLRSVNPRVKIYVCKLMPVFTGHPRFMSSTFTWYQEAQEKIEQVARINHTGLIDLYEAFHDRPDLITDAWTLHPNIKGAAKLSEVIYENLTGHFGGLKIADIFTDNMVLQRNKPIPVWGSADAGTSVKVSFDNRTLATKAGPDGKWKIYFPALEASAKPRMMTIENAGRKTVFRNILVGDVWLCSGQSNMYFSLEEARGGDSAARRAGEKEALRLFKYVPVAETTDAPWDSAVLAKTDDLDFFHGHWKLNNEAAAREFSAVGYWFGKKIREEEHIPVGLIELATGGSPLISWLDRLTLESDPLFEPALHGWRRSDYIMKWCRDRADENLKNASSPFQRHPYDPCFNFEAGIAKITQFPIKGVIWYQGESDADNAELYSKLFPIFVKDWRRQWGYDFPFYYVQLSSLDRGSWTYFRDMQRKLLGIVPHSGMAVSIDLGDSTNVHYRDKQPVGWRLANLALRDTYGKTAIIPEGPLVTGASRKRRRIILRFSYAEGLTASDGKALHGFEILDDKGYLKPVKAIIEGDKVIINVPEDEVAEKVLYAWKPFTRANLVNGAGLPASTFAIKVEN